MRVVVTGGGTGGHLYPSVAIATRFLSGHPEAQILFIGSLGGPESDAAREFGFAFEGVKVKGIAGKNPVAVMRSMALFLKGTWHCRRLLRLNRPTCVVGTGGFASAPACFAAVWLGIPLILHEMNYRPGLVIRVLSRRAHAVAISFPGTQRLLPGKSRTVVTGTPVRREIEELADRGTAEHARLRALEKFGLETGRRTLLVFGGSQGAMALNTALWDSIPEVSGREDLQILHITGKSGYDDPGREAAQERLSGATLLYRALPYIEQIYLAYAVADLAVTRAGASTMAELKAGGVPAVLVPYPYATADHQELNALQSEVTGAALCVRQDGDSAIPAIKEALRLLDDREALSCMAVAAAGHGDGSGAERIVRLMEELS